MNVRPSFGLRVFRTVLRLGPSSLRLQFGAELERTVREKADQLGARCGLWARSMFWVSEWIALARTGIGIWCENVQRPGVTMMTMTTGFVGDLRFAVRSLRRRPALTLTAVLTLALAIGATTGIFSVVQGVLLRPLGYAEPGRLVQLWETDALRSNPQQHITGATFVHWQERLSSFAGLAAYQPDFEYTLTGQGTPEIVRGARLYSNTFALLGADAALGRTFIPEEDHPSDQGSVILSDRIWRRRYGGDPSIVGSVIVVEGLSKEVIGVMPSSFVFPDERTDVWIPYNLSTDAKQNRRSHILMAVGRLHDGTSLEAARAEIEGVTSALVRQYPTDTEGIGASVVPLRADMVRDIRPTLLLLLGSVSLVLLIASVNITGLGLARNLARSREVDVRLALGSGRGRIVRLLVAESTVVAIAGGALGVLIAWWSLPGLLSMVPGDLPRASEIAVDRGVLAFTLLLTVSVALFVGIVPALRVGRGANPTQHGGRTTTSRDGRALGALVVVEVAATVMLMLAGGLLLRSYSKLRAVDPGFSAHNVVSANIRPSLGRYPDQELLNPLYDQILDRVGRIPGVSSVAATNRLALRDAGATWGFVPEGTEDRGSSVRWDLVAGDYFDTMEIPLLSGRAFGPDDLADSELVMVIDETTAEMFFPGKDAVGERVRLWDGSPWFKVVGVVGTVRFQSLRSSPRPVMYSPFTQNLSRWRRSLTLVVSAEGAPRELIPALRVALSEIDAELPLDRIRLLGDVVYDSLSEDRFRTLMLTALALLALVLSTLGVYGTVSFGVARRTKELVIRTALGASKLHTVRSVVARGLMLTMSGAVLGAAGALLVIGPLQEMLFGVSPLDPMALAITTLTLTASALVASAVPAWRAGAVDPASALRED